MTVQDDINKARAIYRKKKMPAEQKPQPKQISAPAQKRNDSIKGYFSTFFNIMKRDILVALGIQKKIKEREEFMKYKDFMEDHFNGRC